MVNQDQPQHPPNNKETAMFFRAIEDFTPANVTRALEALQPGVQVAEVAILSQHQGSASHLLIENTYAPGADCGLPPRMFVKTSLDASRDALPSGFADTLAGELALTMYVSEVKAYALINAEMDIEAPKIFALDLGEAAGDFYLFMENLTERGAICPKVIPALEVGRIENLLTNLARLHAAYWQSPRLGGDLGWLEASTEGKLSQFLRKGGWDPIATEFQIPYKAAILKDIGIDAEHMYQAFWRRQEALNQWPQTLLHGDAHPGNIYFLPDGQVGLLDWQLARRGPWAHDVSYAIISALDPDDRRRCERDMLRDYRAELTRLGVANPPSEDDLWLAHRQTPAWGVPMWGSTPAVMYSQEEVETVVRRFGTAWVDFDTSGALGI